MKYYLLMIFCTLFCWFPQGLNAQRCISPDTAIFLGDSYDERQLISLGDINGDGADEVLIHSGYDSPVYLLDGHDRELSLFEFNFSLNVKQAGDINNDNFDDVMVIENNAITVFLGSPEGNLKNSFPTITGSLLFSDTVSSATIISILSVGDLNKDGFDDILVTAGARTIDFNLPIYRLFVLYGSATAIELREKQGKELPVSTGSIPFEFAGDINNDGFFDYFLRSQMNNRVGIIYQGTADIIDTSKYVEIVTSRSSLFHAFVLAKDVNGDQYDDFILSFANGLGPHPDYYTDLYLGGPGSRLESKWSAISPEDLDYTLEFGRNVISLGDFNNDGFNDFMVVGYRSGSGRVYLGNSGDIPTIGNIILDQSIPQIAGPLDIDGDGLKDVVGFTGFDENEEGSVLLSILFGRKETISGTYSCAFPIRPETRIIGEKVTGAGDVNGDGFSDVLSGSSWDKEIEEPIGTLILYYGGKIPLITSWSIKSQLEEYFAENISGIGDINGDGFDDFAALSEYTDYKDAFGRIYFFMGSVDGPHQQADFILQGTIKDYLSFDKPGVGDVNNDGYDDILLLGSNSRSVLYKGNANGFDSTVWWSYPFRSIPVGDLNNDGFFDLIINRNDSFCIAYGTGSGPEVSNSWYPGQGFESCGDLNGDGFADFIAKDLVNSRYVIYSGRAFGLKLESWSVSGVRDLSKAGDFNFDGFDDIVVVKDYFASGTEGRVLVYFGSSSGLSDQAGWVAGDLFGEDYYSATFVGDVNGDGVDDFFAGNDLFTGYKANQRECPKLITLSTDPGKCSSTALGVDPILATGERLSDFSFKVWGATQLAGSGSLSGHILNKGLNYVNYFLTANPGDSCSFLVNVIDKESPIIHYTDTLISCFNTDGSYHIEYKTSDNCGVDSTWYTLYGYFPDGSVEGRYGYQARAISISSTDSSGNGTDVSGWVLIGNKPRLSIPNAFMVNPAQSKPNTIYLGYANNSLRLSGYMSGGIPPFKYKWSTGDTTRYLRIKHNIAGNYKYYVTVTDRGGCELKASTLITVVDNYCTNDFNKLLTTYFPWLLNEPFIQNFLTGIGKIRICHNGNPDCLSTSLARDAILSGATIGECINVLPSNTSIKIKAPNDDISISVYPNPTINSFHLQLEIPDFMLSLPYCIQLFDSKGRMVYKADNLKSQSLDFGTKLSRGIYYCIIRSENLYWTRQLIKL